MPRPALNQAWLDVSRRYPYASYEGIVDFHVSCDHYGIRRPTAGELESLMKLALATGKGIFEIWHATWSIARTVKA